MKTNNGKQKPQHSKVEEADDADETIKQHVESNNTVIDYVVKIWNRAKGILTNTTGYMYLSAGILITAYIFYQLGYCFIYGIYFGSVNTSIHMMDLFINQIPFEFKFVSIVGFVVFLATCFYYYPIHMFVLSKTPKTKLLWAFFSAITIATICFSYHLLLGMNPNDTAMDEVGGMLIISSATIAMMATFMKLVFVGKHIDTLVFLCYSVVFIGLMTFIGDLLKFDSAVHTVSYLSFMSLLSIAFAGVADYIIFLDTSNKKTMVFKTVLAWTPAIAFCVLLFWYATAVIRYVLISVVAIGLLIYKYKKNNKKSPAHNESAEKSVNRAEDSGWKNFQKYITTFILLFCSLIPIIIYLFIGNTLYMMGSAFGEKESLNSYSRIEYYKSFNDEQPKSIDGIIVAQNSAQYFISNRNRELVLIASPYVKISPID